MELERPEYSRPQAVPEQPKAPLIERAYAVEDALNSDEHLVASIEQYHKNVRQKIEELVQQFGINVT